ncbi:MAG TPA: hypothetical protein VEB39_09150 [Sphingomicrobium sp.]|nr:hypothetical protein [Sphingomicrobium sp.]
MCRVEMLNQLSLALLLLACSRSDPVDEDAVAPAANLVGDMAADGLAAPANAAAAEAAQQAAVPPATGGLAWTYRQQDRAALFGPPGSPAFSIQCQKPREGEPQLIFVRYLPPSSGGTATLSFTGNGQAASLPVSAVTDPSGIGGQWRAMVPPGDHARDVAEIFAGPGAVNLSVSGTAPLVVPSASEPRRVLADCLGG